MSKRTAPRQGNQLRVGDAVTCMSSGKRGYILEITTAEEGQVARVDFHDEPIFTGLLVELGKPVVKPIRPGYHDWLEVTIPGVPNLYAGCRRFSQHSWGVYFREGDPLSADPHTLIAFGQRPGQEEDATSRQDAIEFATKCLVAGRIL